jgi:uncharacterized protein (DUF2235 family)
MGRNIVIFSDGTGQRGGVFVDENRSNIYKLYRATRCGPDCSVNPAEQLTFYDPGLGTDTFGSTAVTRFYRWIRNNISQATGLGLTSNIIDCYAAIVRLWRPGDKIFLFGFSRGAYTVRALSGVLRLCGVPTKIPDGSEVLHSEQSSIAIAKDAVKNVYQHTSSRRYDDASAKDQCYLTQREKLGERFRQNYGSADGEHSNAEPHFIGVFDTVASLANLFAVTAFIILGLIILLVLSAGISLALNLLELVPFSFAFIGSFGTLLLATLISGLIWYVRDHYKNPGALPGFTAKQTRHWTEFRMRFYDARLSTRVRYARHAISIDEDRSAFPRVRWGTVGDINTNYEDGTKQFVQMWFAGNHSNIGGSYSENDSRLSDIALKWMVDEAIKAGLRVDGRYLQLFPDPLGPQHDERRSFLFRLSAAEPRTIREDAPLHPTVIERFKGGEVLHYDRYKEYRPTPLRNHIEAKQFYSETAD